MSACFSSDAASRRPRNLGKDLGDLGDRKGDARRAGVVGLEEGSGRFQVLREASCRGLFWQRNLHVELVGIVEPEPLTQSHKTSKSNGSSYFLSWSTGSAGRFRGRMAEWPKS